MTSDARAVLLVEDNPDDEELTLRGLGHANLSNAVDLARDGQEALDYPFGNHDQTARPVPVVGLLSTSICIGSTVSKSSRGSARRSAPAGCPS